MKLQHNTAQAILLAMAALFLALQVALNRD
jgi:hypothetical protein